VSNRRRTRAERLEQTIKSGQYMPAKRRDKAKDELKEIVSRQRGVILQRISQQNSTEPTI
jgi:hypothetical protein